ncbi:MAG: hypothetical protein KDB88_10145 [Flavobacteriales bacterium]|nr:hypothetical protein [Flavobacteriales bacterium]
MDIKAFIADQLGMFSLYDLPGALFVVLIGAALGWCAARASLLKGVIVRQMAFWGALSAFAGTMVKAWVRLALALLGMVMLFRSGDRDAGRTESRLKAFVVIAGGACGTGAALVAVLVSLPVLLLLYLSSRGGEDSAR